MGWKLIKLFVGFPKMYNLTAFGQYLRPQHQKNVLKPKFISTIYHFFRLMIDGANELWFLHIFGSWKLKYWPKVVKLYIFGKPTNSFINFHPIAVLKKLSSLSIIGLFCRKLIFETYFWKIYYYCFCLPNLGFQGKKAEDMGDILVYFSTW